MTAILWLLVCASGAGASRISLEPTPRSSEAQPRGADEPTTAPQPTAPQSGSAGPSGPFSPLGPLSLATPTEQGPSSEATTRTALVSVERHLGDETVRPVMGTDFEYIIEVSWQGDIDLSAPEAPKLNGLEWKNLRTRDEVAGGRVKREYIFDLKPLAEGPVSVGAARLYYTDRATKAQASIEAPGMDFSVAPAPRDYRRMAGAIAITALGALAAAGGAYAYRRAAKRARLAKLQQAPPEPSPIETLRQGNEDLNTLLIEGSVREYFSLLARRARAFVSLTGDAPMEKLTTEQIRDHLNALEPPRPDRTRIVNLLERCDAVRFAGHAPTREECDAAMHDWKDLLEGGMTNAERGT